MLFEAAVAILALGAAPLAAAQDPYAITGVPVAQGAAVPLRRNINELQYAGGPTWDLYIRALSAMQAANANDPLSYFQIEGIHGKPYIQWNGTGPQRSTGWAGYCPHGEALFASWHRPYVLLFEQALVSQAKQIASTYPQRYRQQYQQAANNLRAPYWDWAADSTVPAATVPPTIQVNFPNGQGLQRRNIANPLYSYRFPQRVINGEFGSFSTFDSEMRTQTVRCPAPDSYPNSANNDLGGRPYKQWIYDAFTRATDFTNFAVTSNTVVSLEQIHNGIHWDGACGQQFVSPDLSAFDPLFMLHHVNVDRMWAYWQALKPNEDIFKYSYQGLSRFSTPGGTVITPKSPLSPFFAPRRVPHTTESVRNVKNFGYTYQALDGGSQAIMTLINNLYGTGVSARRRRDDQPQQVRRYFAHVHLDKAEVEKPCQVSLYLDGKKAGSLVVMSQPATGNLTAGLTLDQVIQQNDMHTLSTNETVDAIKATLTVQIVKSDGSVIDHTKVPSLKVALEDVLVTKPEADDQFPKFGNSRVRTVMNHKKD